VVKITVRYKPVETPHLLPDFTSYQGASKGNVPEVKSFFNTIGQNGALACGGAAEQARLAATIHKRRNALSWLSGSGEGLPAVPILRVAREGGQAIDREVWPTRSAFCGSCGTPGALGGPADRAGKQDDRPLMPFGLGLAVTAGPPYCLGLGPSSRGLNCRGSFFQRPGGHRAVSRHSGVSAPSCYFRAVDLGTLALRVGRKRSSVHVR
jgi:hypothetical protein